MSKIRWILSSFVFPCFFLASAPSWSAKRPLPPEDCQDDIRQPLPKISPIIAKAGKQPFNDPNYLFEVKYDGFRGVGYFERGRACKFISRNDNTLSQFRELCEDIADELKVDSAIFDGEVIAPDPSGRPIFERMLRQQAPFRYVAFDLLWLDGEDLRALPLVERRRKLLKVLPKGSTIITESLAEIGHGVKLFNLMAQHDLEGIVAKRLDGKYTRSTHWYKIKYKDYSQAFGRQRFFK